MAPVHMRLLSFFLLALLFFTINVQGLPNELVKRVPQAAQPPPASSNTPPPASSGATANSSAPVSASTTSQNNALNSLPTSASYGNNVQPGTAIFLAPTSTRAVWPLYRIDPQENVTFSWTYTNILVAPVNLTLVAVGPQSATYTISEMGGGADNAVWHIGSAMTSSPPLMNGYYNIQLYDQRGISAPVRGGYLKPFNSLTIAFYSTENYGTVTAGNYCPTCFYSAAMRYTTAVKPLSIAFGVACATSFMFIYGLLY